MKRVLSKGWPILLISLLCLVLITVWFKDGRLLATGEDGLLLINPDRALEIYKYSWNEVESGWSLSGYNTMLPLYYLESLILKAGIPIWIFQASLFFLLMLTGSISVYFLVKELFQEVLKKRNEVQVAFIAALFYILNPVSLLTIWYRGMAVYSFIFFYALVPTFLYFFVRGLNSRKLSFIFITPLSGLFLSAAFSSPSEPFSLWLLPFIYSLIMAFILHYPKKKEFKLFPLVYFMCTFLFWVLINSWWIFPYVEFSKTVYFENKSSLINAINTLRANSQDFTLDNVIRLTHGGFLYKNEAFGSIYKNPVFLLMGWLIPIITIYGLFKLNKSKIKLFFIFSLVLLIFLAKGTSPPGGGIFLWLFSNIGYLQVYRNSFEKIGMLMPVVYAPLFSLGVFYLIDKMRGLKRQMLFLVLIIIGLAVYSWPLFSGAIVSFGKRNIEVEVPMSFSNANEAIEGRDHVILSIPVMGGASGFYKWKYGFKGVDASPYLFNYPVVNIFYDDTTFTGRVLVAFSNGYLNNLTAMAQLFSADIVAYRKDTDVPSFGYNLDALNRAEDMITSSKLKKVFDSKEVSLWSLPIGKAVPLIYTPESVRFIDSPKELISLLENDKLDLRKEAFICNISKNCNPFLKLENLPKDIIESAPEKIEFSKISPVDYEIKVHNSKGRFLLIFNNNFHTAWNLYIQGSLIPSNKHIIVNGYANGFIIDKLGDFEISLRFKSEEMRQKVYQIAIFSILAGIIILLMSRIFHYKK